MFANGVVKCWKLHFRIFVAGIICEEMLDGSKAFLLTGETDTEILVMSVMNLRVLHESL